MRNDFNSVDYVGNQRYVFNIKGNHYRLVVAVKFTLKIVYIRFVGTHDEYEKEHFPIETPSLPATINSRLVENKWSQKELATMLGITAPRLSAILSGKAHPTYEQARVISSKLNIDPAIVLAI